MRVVPGLMSEPPGKSRKPRSHAREVVGAPSEKQAQNSVNDLVFDAWVSKVDSLDSWQSNP